ncbi:transposase [Fredinandcohnia humi]
MAPKIMTKIVLYGYSKKIYSCRDIATLLVENIPAMWLAALQKPDYRTINDFRGKHMGKFIQPLFEQMIHQLIEQKYISMEITFWMVQKSKPIPISILLFGKRLPSFFKKSSKRKFMKPINTF